MRSAQGIKFTPEQIEAIREYILRVNSRAEQTIRRTNMVSDAHWNAMKEEWKRINPEGKEL